MQNNGICFIANSMRNAGFLSTSKYARSHKECGRFKESFKAWKETIQSQFLMPTLIEPVDINIFKNHILLFLTINI